MSKPLCIIVTGSRVWDDNDEIDKALLDIMRSSPCAVLIHGDAAGLDRAVERWVVIEGGAFWRLHAVPALWDTYGKSAGPLRNALMIEIALAYRKHGYEAECHAFPLKESKGTWDTMRKCEAAGIPVFNHGYRKSEE